ncbi:hypothetical protein D3C71_1436360 [compost metagenome]
MAGGEGGDDDFVERQGKRQHAAGQQRRAEVRQDDVAEGLPAVGAEVHRGLDQTVRGTAQTGDDVVVDDHHAEGRVADDDGEHPRLDAQCLEGCQQRDPGDDPRQGDRQDQHQRDALLAEEVSAVQCRRSQRAKDHGNQRGNRGDLQRQLDGFEHVRPGERHADPLPSEALGRKAERRVFGVEGVQEDDQDREVQEHQPAPGGEAQAQGSFVRVHRRPPVV